MHNDSDKAALTAKLTRLRGHIGGVMNMIEENRGCEEIILQLMAIEGIIKKLSIALLQDHLTHCVKDSIAAGMTDELDKFSKMLNLFA